MPTEWTEWIATHRSLWSAGVLVVALLLSASIYALVSTLLHRWARRSESPVDEAMVRHLRAPLRWLVPMASLALVGPLVTLPRAVLQPVRHVLSVAVIGLLAWGLVRALSVAQSAVIRYLDRHATDDVQARAVVTQVKGFRNIASFVIGLVAVAFILMTFDTVRELGVSLLASAGIAGVVVGFAAQRSIATVVAGIQVALAQPIRVDDVVIVEGEWGRIEEITLTYVVVRTWDLRRLVVPINYFIEKPFQNWTRSSADLLATVFIHADYRIPVDEVRRELGRILEGNDRWDGKVWALQVTGATDRTVELRALMSACDAGKAWDLRCQVREQLIAFIHDTYPQCLPRLRADIEPAPAPPGVSPPVPAAPGGDPARPPGAQARALSQ